MNKIYGFIGGAPKCGTSSIFDVLSRMKNVTPSSPKETFYFLAKGHPLLNQNTNFHRHGIEGFDTFFGSSKNPNYLEATSHLIYQTELIPTLKQINAKVVFVLRNPSERIQSSFFYTQNNLGRIKQGLSFKEYSEILLSERVGQLSHWITNKQSLYVLQRELEYSNYVSYLEQWITQLNSNIKVMFYENMIANQEGFYVELCDFLNIEFDAEAINNDLKNVTFEIKHKKIHFLMSKIRDMGVFKKSIFKPFKAMYKRLQSKKVSVDKNTDDLVNLNNYFYPYNRRLEQLLNKTTPW